MTKFNIKGSRSIDDVFPLSISVEDVRGGYGKVKDIRSYEWGDLDGKTLLLRVIEDDNGTDMKCKTLCGYNPIDGTTYVLAIEISE